MAEDFDGEEFVDHEESTLPDNSGERLELETHQLINSELNGIIEDLQDGYARVRFVASDTMSVDKRGLIHSGFVFSSANFAAIAAVNKQNAVLAVSKCNFLAPLRVEDEVVFEAKTMQNVARKRTVMVVGMMDGVKVFEAEFAIVVLEKHPLSMTLAME